MEEATQPSTQPFLDPRRLGTNSSLQDQDDADIICILLPTSPAAHTAIQLTADAAPQHILQNHAMSHIEEESAGDVEQTTSNASSQGSESEALQNDDDKPGSEKTVGTDPARDIALRFSSKVQSLTLGFVFGRNPHLCDLLLGDSKDKNLSNRHFRIFMNMHGSLMLEDTSTNGTVVENVVLKSDRHRVPQSTGQQRHTLTNLSTIEIVGNASIRFTVRMPNRDHVQDKYNQNLVAYLACLQQAERQQAVVAQAAVDGKAPIVPPVSSIV